MAVKVRERVGKGWYVLTDWRGQRKANFFGKNKALAKAFADKLAARLKWAEQSGESVTLATPDGTIPTVEAYLTEWLTVYAEAHCKVSTAEGYRQVVRRHILPALGSRLLCDVTRKDLKRLIASTEILRPRSIQRMASRLRVAVYHRLLKVVQSRKVVISKRAQWRRRSHISPQGLAGSSFSGRHIHHCAIGPRANPTRDVHIPEIVGVVKYSRVGVPVLIPGVLREQKLTGHLATDITGNSPRNEPWSARHAPNQRGFLLFNNLWNVAGRKRLRRGEAHPRASRVA